MAVNTLIEGNFLIINEGTADAVYWNASWISIYFDSDSVYLVNNSLPDGDISWRENPIKILFTDFQYDSVAYSTKGTIATILSDKIG